MRDLDHDLLRAFPEQPVRRRAFRSDLLKRWSHSAVQGALARLMQVGLVARVSRGVYVLTDAGRAARAAERAAPPGDRPVPEGPPTVPSSAMGVRPRRMLALDRALLLAFAPGPVARRAVVAALQGRQPCGAMQNAFERLLEGQFIERISRGVYALTAFGQEAQAALQRAVHGP